MAAHWVVGQIGGRIGDFNNMRSHRCLTWHEKEDTTTMILVPEAIHGFVHHSGGIQVLTHHGIGAGREEPYQMEPKNVRGEELCRVMDLDLWRRAGKPWMSGADSAGELTISYICEDPDAGPTPAQQAKANELLAGWTALAERAQKLLKQYMDEEWPSEEKSGWTAQAKELIIHPEESWARMTAGILWDSSLEPEHGLGIRIRGDGSMEAGNGDIAL